MFKVKARTGVAAVVAVVAAASGATPAGAQAPRQPFSDRGFPQMTAADQLRSMREQTGGGHVALIGSKRYIRYPNGQLRAF